MSREPTKRNASGAELRARYRSLPRVSEQMQAWSAMLADELRTWLDVRERPMFGLIAFYRRNQIFAALPKTRAVASPSSFIFRLPKNSPARESKVEADPRIDTSGEPLWLPFELTADTDVRGALSWLRTAYEEATGTSEKRTAATERGKKRPASPQRRGGRRSSKK